MLFAATGMDLDIITLSDVSQTKTSIISYCLYVESKVNLFTQQKETHGHRKQTYSYQRGKWVGERNKEGGINIYTLLCIKQITNKDLLFSTGNYTIL